MVLNFFVGEWQLALKYRVIWRAGSFYCSDIVVRSTFLECSFSADGHLLKCDGSDDDDWDVHTVHVRDTATYPSDFGQWCCFFFGMQCEA